jgi:hypothetical protein
MTAASREVDLVDRLEARAQALSTAIASQPSVRRIHAPDFLARASLAHTLTKPVVWRNEIFVGPEFRWAHVEFFSIRDQIGVIHVCILPALDRHAPIFGFDIITGIKKATGAFLDLSPTTAEAMEISDAWAADTKRAAADFQEKRELPEWASAVFSQHALAIRPTSISEVEGVLGLAESSLSLWLRAEKRVASGAAMARAQQSYVEAQRRNEHTFRMLAGCVGAEIATEFVNQWLFPAPWEPEAAARRLSLAG